MDVNSNRLVGAPDGKDAKFLEEFLASNAEYQKVPRKLADAADKKLAADGELNEETGMVEATVSKTSGGKLSRWAAAQRRAQKQKSRARAKDKIAAKSRKKNR
jgi:hypothetical protein